jgi:hypothetical protein
MLGGGIAQLQTDLLGAVPSLEASVAMWRALGDPVGLAHALATLAVNRIGCGEFGHAEAMLREGRAMAEAGGEPFTMSEVLTDLGILALMQKQYARAGAYLRESLAVGRTIDRPSYRTYAVVRALHFLGRAEAKLSSSHSASALLKEALAAMRQSGFTGILMGNCLDALAAEAGRSGDPVRAARLFGAADTQWRRTRTGRFPQFAHECEADERAVRIELGEDGFQRAWKEGRAMDVERAFAYALDEVT